MHNYYYLIVGIKSNDNNKISKSLSKFDDVKIPYRQPKVIYAIDYSFINSNIVSYQVD